MLSPNGIRTILFDLDGTLRLSKPQGGEVVRGQLISHGVPVSHDDRRRNARWEHEYWASSADLLSDLEIYQDGSPEFWLNYSHRQLLSLGAESTQAVELAPLIHKYMWDHYRPDSVPAPEAHAMLIQLKEAGFKLGVVSNRDRPFVDELERIGLDSFFEFSLAGGEVRVFKPEPGIFEAALVRIGSQAHETVYVGDNYFADVVGARRAGLKPVLYDPDGLYPEADCCIIGTYSQLPDALKTL